MWAIEKNAIQKKDYIILREDEKFIALIFEPKVWEEFKELKEKYETKNFKLEIIVDGYYHFMSNYHFVELLLTNEELTQLRKEL